ncbi:hypothetical protein KV29_0201900 [Enterobacter hormaechei subsp. xiangfangensis]|nr:hypothetical protein KV17_20750 [Enterobacter hormaechei subsp. xiangfangensis]KHM56127.1 hypothetical protein KV29_0201900 [Enterobacter hormaechei subsp. xiangfangensis]
MNKFFGENPIKLTDGPGMNTPKSIRIPEFTFAAPAFQFEKTVIIEPVNNLCRWLFRLAPGCQHNGRSCENGT